MVESRGGLGARHARHRQARGTLDHFLIKLTQGEWSISLFLRKYDVADRFGSLGVFSNRNTAYRFQPIKASAAPRITSSLSA